MSASSLVKVQPCFYEKPPHFPFNLPWRGLIFHFPIAVHVILHVAVHCTLLESWRTCNSQTSKLYPNFLPCFLWLCPSNSAIPFHLMCNCGQCLVGSPWKEHQLSILSPSFDAPSTVCTTLGVEEAQDLWENWKIPFSLLTYLNITLNTCFLLYSRRRQTLSISGI